MVKEKSTRVKKALKTSLRNVNHYYSEGVAWSSIKTTLHSGTGQRFLDDRTEALSTDPLRCYHFTRLYFFYDNKTEEKLFPTRSFVDRLIDWVWKFKIPFSNFSVFFIRLLLIKRSVNFSQKLSACRYDDGKSLFSDVSIVYGNSKSNFCQSNAFFMELWRLKKLESCPRLQRHVHFFATTND